jgi:hypothetical protein
MKYAGMASMIIATLGVAIFLGIKLDAYFKFKFPLSTILLPLFALVSIFYKVYTDSTRKK